MQSGKLRFRAQIQQKAQTTSSSGQNTIAWSELDTVWCSVRTLTGREYFAHDKANAEVTHIVVIRWLDTVTTEMRIVWDSRTLNIESIAEDKTHERMMVLRCKEDRD
jgi:SPP1 family predicted phage head-tail adaptor